MLTILKVALAGTNGLIIGVGLGNLVVRIAESHKTPKLIKAAIYVALAILGVVAIFSSSFGLTSFLEAIV